VRSCFRSFASLDWLNGNHGRKLAEAEWRLQSAAPVLRDEGEQAVALVPLSIRST
jgi:hypothetical protein